MGNLIIYDQRNVPAKGLRKDNILRQEKVEEYLFLDDLRRLILLSKQQVTFPHQDLRVFYPGCGADILYPLFFLEKIFPKAATIKMSLNDVDGTMPFIRTIFDDIGIHFAEKGDAISFYWKNILIHLDHLQGNVFRLDLPPFNVYFEKAFRIMKDSDPDYEQRIYDHLEQGGILISDSGFQQQPLARVEVPSELSSYGEMVVGRKK